MLEILQFGLIVKLFFSVLTLFYLVFLLVVYRQIVLMTQVLESNLSPLIRVVALGQIVGAIFLFVLALILA